MTPGADRIVDVALELLDREGLDRLSTRRLASALNMQGPSLYHHFRNKAELLGQMAACMLRRSLTPLDRAVSWEVWLRSMAHATRKMALQRRDGARLLACSYPNEDMQHQLIPGLAQPLIAAGFSVRAAREQVTVMATFVLGWSINEQNERMRQLLGESVTEIDSAFTNGVETLLAGMATRRERKSRMSTVSEQAGEPATGMA